MHTHLPDGTMDKNMYHDHANASANLLPRGPHNGPELTIASNDTNNAEPSS